MWERFRKNESGFTLVELLAVMIIIAVLAAVAIPTMSGSMEKAKKNRYLDEVRRVGQVMQQILLEDYANGSYDLFEFGAKVHGVMEPSINQVAKRLDGDYTPGAMIEEFEVNESEVRVDSLVYKVASYTIYLSFEDNQVLFR